MKTIRTTLRPRPDPSDVQVLLDGLGVESLAELRQLVVAGRALPQIALALGQLAAAAAAARFAP